MKNPRRIAYEILLSVLYEGAYSNIAINKALRNSDLQNMDRGFVTELVYGTISKKLYLAYMIQKFSKTPIKKLSKEVMTILYMGLYQILYMDSVTEFAAVDESVKLCKKVFPKGSGFVNGVLRNILRDEDASEIHMKDKKQYLSVRYNVSMDIVTLFDHQYGSAEAEHILQALEEKPALYIRANALKISAAELQKMLEAEVHLVQAVQEEPSALQVANFKRIETNEAYRKGLFTVQDISSMQAVRALDPQEGETILDICASPGGKSTFIAELMNNKGKIYARDISERKLKLVESTAERLGIDIIETAAMDGTVLAEGLKDTFDRVLVDAPCSGLGIIRKKPELRYKTLKDIEPIYEVQAKILENAWQYLKSGGILVYATCTINKDENEKQIEAFLSKKSTSEYALISQETKLFRAHESDGFYVAKIKKN